MKTKIILLILSVFVLAGYWFFNKSERVKDSSTSLTDNRAMNPYKDAEIKAVIIPSENNTFGYDIYVHGAVLVHQPSRPGIAGNAGFATEEDAMKVAKLVIKKIRNNELPPTVTIDELRELGVL